MQKDHQIITIAEKEYIGINPDTKKPGSKTWEWFPHQKPIINHLCAGLEAGAMPFDTAIYSCPKKGGKTGFAGAFGHAWARSQGGEIYFVANSDEQANDRSFQRIQNYLAHIENHKPQLYNRIVEKRTNDAIEYKNPYALLRPIPCSAASQAGSYASLSIWDELWGYDQESSEILWSEFSPIPQLFGKSLRLVVTYAGHRARSNLLWKLYLAGVDPSEHPEGQATSAGLLDAAGDLLPVYENGAQLTYWDHIHRAPEITGATPAFLAARKADTSVRANDYERLWHNNWTAGEEEYITAATIAQCKALGHKHLQGNMFSSFAA